MHDDVHIKNLETAEVGNHVAIDKGFYCTTKLLVGDYVHIAPYVIVIGGNTASLTMKHFSGMAAGCRVICASDNYSSGMMMNPQVPAKYRDVINEPVVFEPFSCTGVNSVIMPGVTLSEGSVIGANSLVTKTTEPWTVYVGSPARPIKIRKKEKIIESARELGYSF